MKTAQRSRPDRRRLSTTLADQRSRRLLSCVRDGPATVRDLAVALAAAEAVALAAADLDCARAGVTTADRRQYRRQLAHRYLPQLTDAGLVERSADGLVRYVPTALEKFDVRMPPLDEPDHPSWPAAAAVLGRAYRYPLVAAVAEGESVSLSHLADRLAGTEGAAATARDLAISLHHIDLPKLASVDLLTYDPETRTVQRAPAIETVL